MIKTVKETFEEKIERFEKILPEVFSSDSSMKGLKKRHDKLMKRVEKVRKEVMKRQKILWVKTLVKILEE